MDIVIGTYPEGHGVFMDRRLPLHVAEVIDPSTFWSGGSGVLYRSPPLLRLNACANAIAWARANGHRVLAGEEARGSGALPDHN